MRGQVAKSCSHLRAPVWPARAWQARAALLARRALWHSHLSLARAHARSRSRSRCGARTSGEFVCVGGNCATCILYCKLAQVRTLNSWLMRFGQGGGQAVGSEAEKRRNTRRARARPQGSRKVGRPAGTRLVARKRGPGPSGRTCARRPHLGADYFARAHFWCSVWPATRHVAHRQGATQSGPKLMGGGPRARPRPPLAWPGQVSRRRAEARNDN